MKRKYDAVTQTVTRDVLHSHGDQYGHNRQDPASQGITYRAIIKRNGSAPKTKCFKTKTAARQWARRIESDLELIEALGEPWAKITLAELASEYLDPSQSVPNSTHQPTPAHTLTIAIPPTFMAFVEVALTQTMLGTE